jgi:hypothetical protein
MIVSPVSMSEYPLNPGCPWKMGSIPFSARRAMSCASPV